MGTSTLTMNTTYAALSRMASTAKRRGPLVRRGNSAPKLSTTSVPVTAHVDSSMTLPMKLVVSVVYQEQSSAQAMNGTSIHEATTAPRRPAARAYCRSTSENCVTSESSAAVAT